MKTLITLLVLCLVNVGCCAEKLACEECGHLILVDHIKKINVLDYNNANPAHRDRSANYCSRCVPEGVDTLEIDYGRRAWLAIRPKPEPKKEPSDAYTCYECSHLFKPGTGKDVTTSKFDSAHIASGTVHFCKPCSPKYDRIVTKDWNLTVPVYVKRVPPVAEQWIVVDKDGNELAVEGSYTISSTNNIIYYLNK